MNRWWDKQAGRIQAMSFGDYPNKDDAFTKKDSYEIVLHTRQDLILAVCHLSAINEQLQYIQWLLMLIAAMLFGIIGWRWLP